MATYGVRNVYASEENQVLTTKIKPEPQVKRTVLKEVGNNNVQCFQKLPTKPSLPTVKVPMIKQTLVKEPSIKVKDTKAFRLRTQHSRQSINKVPDKKTALVSEPGVKNQVVTKPEPLPKITRSVFSTENSHQHRPQNTKLLNGVVKPKESKPDFAAAATIVTAAGDTLNPYVAKINANARCEAPTAFSSTLLNCAYVDIDKEDENDPIMLGMYAKDMYKYLREMEVKYPVAPQYLKSSKLTGRMRATLIDWLVEVQREFELNPETLFLTVAIIDRFLQKNSTINRNQLQLVGITAMFIASKYEEMLLPDISELVYVSDNAYSKQEILQMEITIVKSVDYSFGRPLPIHFLRRYSKADRVPPLVHVLAKYIIEMGIVEYDLCHIVPSLLAAAALYISLWLLKRKQHIWSNNLIQYSNYQEHDILPVVRKLCSILSSAQTSKLQAIRKKYSHIKNLQVSVLPVLKRITELCE